MKIHASGIGVDAGIICISDPDYYKRFINEYAEDSMLQNSFDVVPNGKYKCKWKIPDSWNGELEDEKIIEITSGKIVITDPCYVIDDEWDEFLEDFYEKRNMDNVIVIDNMGGDGVYEVIIDLERID